MPKSSGDSDESQNLEGKTPHAEQRSPDFMKKVDIHNTSISINQLINQIKNGEEIIIIGHGQPIARLSPI